MIDSNKFIINIIKIFSLNNNIMLNFDIEFVVIIILYSSCEFILL